MFGLRFYKELFKALSKDLTCALIYASIFISTFSHAALVGRDLDGNLATFEAYYDDVLDITWLADANSAQTSGYDADGRMNWVDANSWAENLTLGGYSDWRLPNIVDVDNNGCVYDLSGIDCPPHVYASPEDVGNDGCNLSFSGGTDCGFNVDTSTGEMASLFYDTLSNLNFLVNGGPFSNVQTDVYWSATEYAPVTTRAWDFNFGNGLQYGSYKSVSHYAWAVHTGDVGASVVPVPAAAWMFGLGLIGLVGLKCRR